jgi:cytoskeletal protein CcmA (bactofilin family)
MSDLSNLYISESYYGVVNLIDSTEPFASQSEAKIYLTDGLGENLGISFDSSKNITIDNDLRVDGNADFNGNVDISGSFVHTGSIDVIGDITVVGNITAHTGSFDTINTRILHVTLESSSVIFSSGSNVFGDEITDTQTLVGQVSISGSLSVDGNSTITGSLNVTNEISSSTINGIGNVTLYSQSVDSRLTNLELDSASQDQRLDSLENYTSSQDVINSGYNLVTSSLFAYTASTDQRLDSIEFFTASLIQDFVTEIEYSASIAVVTGSLINQIDTKLDTASFDNFVNNTFTPYSSSVLGEITSIENTNNSQQSQINSLISVTGSYAVLSGGNNFTGSQIISGGLEVKGTSTYSGSLSGNVVPLSVVSSTASLDCNLGNFFTLTLPNSTSTHLTATNISPGLTLTLQIKQVGGVGLLEFNSTKFNFPRLNLPVITLQSGVTDIATFVSFDSDSLNGVLTNDFI